MPMFDFQQKVFSDSSAMLEVMLNFLHSNETAVIQLLCNISIFFQVFLFHSCL